MYSEDVDFCVRARAFGARPLYQPAASVLHRNGASSPSIAKKVMVLRGKCTFLRLRWAPWRAGLALGMIHCGVALRAAGGAVLRRGTEWREVWRQRATWSRGWPATP